MLYLITPSIVRLWSNTCRAASEDAGSVDRDVQHKGGALLISPLCESSSPSVPPVTREAIRASSWRMPRFSNCIWRAEEQGWGEGWRWAGGPFAETFLALMRGGKGGTTHSWEAHLCASVWECGGVDITDVSSLLSRFSSLKMIKMCNRACCPLPSYCCGLFFLIGLSLWRKMKWTANEMSLVMQAQSSLSKWVE